MKPALILAVLVLGACAPDETVFSYGAGERTFALQTIDGAPIPGTATISFPEPGRISGQAPCNVYSGALKAPYPWFELGPLAVTRRACLTEGGEAAFFRALESMRLVKVTDGALRLWNETGGEMIFTETPGG
jgi:heat shock protein HslJ